MRLPASLLARPLALLYRAWVATIRVIEVNRPPMHKHHPVITCLWHDELFACPLMRKTLPYAALISPSGDGDYLSGVLRSYGFRIVRGSSSRGGAGALHELVSAVRDEGYGLGLTVDGPRGPRHKAKIGAIWLAAQTGRPLSPTRVFMSRAITFSSWDRFQLPLPFSTMHIVYGDPWYPDVDTANTASMRAACRELERRLDTVTLK